MRTSLDENLYDLTLESIARRIRRAMGPNTAVRSLFWTTFRCIFWGVYLERNSTHAPSNLKRRGADTPTNRFFPCGGRYFIATARDDRYLALRALEDFAYLVEQVRDDDDPLAILGPYWFTDDWSVDDARPPLFEEEE
jgi:hypothetical protein